MILIINGLLALILSSSKENLALKNQEEFEMFRKSQKKQKSLFLLGFFFFSEIWHLLRSI